MKNEKNKFNLMCLFLRIWNCVRTDETDEALGTISLQWKESESLDISWTPQWPHVPVSYLWFLSTLPIPFISFHPLFSSPQPRIHLLNAYAQGTLVSRDASLLALKEGHLVVNGRWTPATENSLQLAGNKKQGPQSLSCKELNSGYNQWAGKAALSLR